MQISQPPIGALSGTLSVSQPAVKSWQVGQVLLAVVVGAAPEGGVQLRVDGRALTAQTSLTLSAGQTLELEVVRTEAPLLLKLRPAAPAEDDQARIETQAWRQALPRQIPLTALFAELARFIRALNQPAPASPLPDSGRQLLENLPTAQTVSTSQGLKQALTDSGLFLEAKLARPASSATSAALATDLKGTLLKLFDDLQPPAAGAPAPADSALRPEVGAPPARTPSAQLSVPMALPEDEAARSGAADLARQVDGALARIQVNQLVSLPAENAPPVWVFELPVRQGGRTDVFDLRIEQDRTGDREEGRSPWTVVLAFDFEELGPVTARLALSREQVSTTLWAQRPQTVQLFTDHLAELHAGLAAAGVEVGRLSVFAGAPPVPADSAPPHLLDLKA